MNKPDSTSPYHTDKQIDFQSMFLDSDTIHIAQGNWQVDQWNQILKKKDQWNQKRHDPIDKHVLHANY